MPINNSNNDNDNDNDNSINDNDHTGNGVSQRLDAPVAGPFRPANYHEKRFADDVAEEGEEVDNREMSCLDQIINPPPCVQKTYSGCFTSLLLMSVGGTLTGCTLVTCPGIVSPPELIKGIFGFPAFLGWIGGCCCSAAGTLYYRHCLDRCFMRPPQEQRETDGHRVLQEAIREQLLRGTAVLGQPVQDGVPPPHGYYDHYEPPFIPTPQQMGAGE